MLLIRIGLAAVLVSGCAGAQRLSKPEVELRNGECVRMAVHRDAEGRPQFETWMCPPAQEDR